MIASQAAKAAARSAVRFGLSVGPARRIAEGLTRFFGRRWPQAYLAYALSYHIVDVLGARANSETRIAELPGGARLVITLRDFALRELYFRGSRTVQRGWLYEPETTRFFIRWLRPGDVLLDIGANAGYYTAIGAARVGPFGQVHAFEPNPPVARLLQKTVAVNGFGDRVQVNALAVTSTGDPAVLYGADDPAQTGQTTTIPRPSLAVVPAITVSSVTVDRYVERNQIRTIRLVKIDVEGAELDVIAGARQTLGVVQPEAVVCEFCPQVLADPTATWEQLLDQMHSFGYQPFLIQADGGLQEFGGSMPEWNVGNVCFLATRK